MTLHQITGVYLGFGAKAKSCHNYPRQHRPDEYLGGNIAHVICCRIDLGYSL